MGFLNLAAPKGKLSGKVLYMPRPQSISYPMANDALQEVWAFDIQSGQSTKLFEVPGLQSFVVSPNYQKIACETDYGIEIRSLPNGDIIQAVSTPIDRGSALEKEETKLPKWSSDSRALAFLVPKPNNKSRMGDLFVLNTEDGSVKTWLNNVPLSGFQWVPGNQQMLAIDLCQINSNYTFDDYPVDVYLVKEDGTMELYSLDTCIFGWSLDGEWSLLQYPSTVWVPGTYEFQEKGLYAGSRDAQRNKILVKQIEGMGISCAKYSPNGTMIAFTISQYSPGGPGFDLWVVNQDGTNLRKLRGGTRLADWLPNSDNLLIQYWTGEQQPLWGIGLLSLDGEFVAFPCFGLYAQYVP
jgi:hypothetical protein